MERYGRTEDENRILDLLSTVPVLPGESLSLVHNADTNLHRIEVTIGKKTAAIRHPQLVNFPKATLHGYVTKALEALRNV